MKIKCDCGADFELPEGWFDFHVPFNFWMQHGHFPALIIFQCICGATQESGPKTWRHGHEQYELDEEFIVQHSTC